MKQTIHLRINKDYAKKLISDLEDMGAIEIVTDEESIDASRWEIIDLKGEKNLYELYPHEV